MMPPEDQHLLLTDEEKARFTTVDQPVDNPVLPDFDSPDDDEGTEVCEVEV